MSVKTTILNIGCGKLLPLDLPESYFLINLDSIEFNESERTHSVLDELDDYAKSFTRVSNETRYIHEDVWDFFEMTVHKFDRIVSYRFLEHIPRENLLSFLWNISTCLKVGGKLDIIVPNHQKLAEMLVNEKPEDIKDQSHDILLTTEFLNEPSEPHASLWSPDRAKYYLGVEKRFEIDEIIENFEFDGRDIYIRILARRVK